MGCCMNTLTWFWRAGNSDNLFDWIDFFKINTYVYFFDQRQNVKQNLRIFWKHGVVPFQACSFQFIRTRSVRGACGKKREDEFWSLRPFLLIDNFLLLNFIRDTFLCNLNLFSCALQILIAWTSCLKLIIPNYIYCGYFCRSNHFEWKTK